MSVYSDNFTILTKGFDDVVDITSKVQDIVSIIDSKNSIVTVSVLSSTCAITTMNNEPGLAYDFSKMFEMFAPVNKVYQHDNSWHDGNAFAHLKAGILGNSITLNVIDKKIQLNPFQNIVLIDFDNKASSLQVVVSVVY